MSISRYKFILSFFLVFFSSFVYSQEIKKRIAVIPFENGEGISKSEAAYITDKVRNSLISTKQFEVISNDQIETMMQIESKKQGVGQGSCNTEKCMIDLGNALECEKMLVGKAAGAFGEYSISAKILDVVTQQYEEAADISTANKNDFPKAAKELVSRLVGSEGGSGSGGGGAANFAGMLWRTGLLPGWGHLYANQSRGYIYIGLFAAVGGAFVFSHLQYQSAEKEYLDATNDFDSKFDAYNSAAGFRGIMSYAFLTTYAIVFSDILFTGKSYASYRNQTYSDFHFNIRQQRIYNKTVSKSNKVEDLITFIFQRRFK